MKKRFWIKCMAPMILIMGCQDQTREMNELSLPPTVKEEMPLEELPPPKPTKAQRVRKPQKVQVAPFEIAGLPVPEQTKIILDTPGSHFAKVRLRPDQMKTFLTEHLPNHRVEVVRPGRAYRAVPHDPEGITVLATWVKDSFRLTYIDPKGQRISSDSPEIEALELKGIEENPGNPNDASKTP